ncbi:MAG: GNAT family N-acetyltransferase [Acidobacteriota bacterium]|nr:GNAT family N-acetyltransferase [Acidobacteriota bacterium]
MAAQSPTIEGESCARVQIRMAVSEDAPRIASVLRDSFIEYEDSYTTGGFAATTPASEEVLKRMEEGPAWVALIDGSIAGTVAAVDRGEDLYVRGMAVLPSARGQQIGELLLREIEDYARARGYRRLTLSTTPFLQRAIRLYERFGFLRSEGGVSDLFGTPLFSMAKDLSHAGMS